jgi:phosphoglucosamine mutase
MSHVMFGTDGVRGTPGVAPLDGETITKLGAAVAAELGGAPRIVCGRDTRESGTWVEQYLAAGIRYAGGTIVSVGVMPTPGVSFVTGNCAFDAGVVISASHNPFPDNGIKVLQASGEKVSREFERRIEARVFDGEAVSTKLQDDVVETADLMDVYEAHLTRIIGHTDLSGLSVGIDCGHGATSEVAPRLLRRFGITPVTLHTAPDGRNINQASGSTHPETLQREVVAQHCEIGFAFDGDGDRVILVNRHGDLVDGDGVLFLSARHLHASGRLVGDGIVATVMSNLGLEMALSEIGITLHRCPVGDWNVRKEMLRRGVCLGGEQSGHIIFSDLLPTGDGLGTALSVLRMLVESGQELDALVNGLTVLPQVLLNVPVNEKREIASVPDLARVIREAEEQLSGHGRVLVRYSGTEPLLRIMLEGPEQATVDRWAKKIATCAKHLLS